MLDKPRIEQREGFDFESREPISGESSGIGRYVPTTEQLEQAALRLTTRTRLVGDRNQPNVGTDGAMVAGAYLELLHGRRDARSLVMEPSIQCFSGVYFHFLKPHEFAWDPEDIAQGLSNQCRFGGQCREFYPIAQHLVLAAEAAPPEHKFEALMHDAHEAFVLDIMTPLKILLPDYRGIEDGAELAMRRHFHLPEHISPEVKAIDLVMLATEKRDIMPADDSNWRILDGVTPLADTIEPWSPQEARKRWLASYFELSIAYWTAQSAARQTPGYEV